jgi:hypothetical protein
VESGWFMSRSSRPRRVGPHAVPHGWGQIKVQLEIIPCQP